MEAACITTMVVWVLLLSIVPKNAGLSCLNQQGLMLSGLHIIRHLKHFWMPATDWACWLSTKRLMAGKKEKRTIDYAMYFDAWWQRDIEAMVLRDRNHPSIIMWSIGNEIIERKKA